MVTWDDHGILCREYIPETEEFDPSQLKIMNYGLYLTDNNWETARAGIGRFTLFNPKTQKDEEVYGVVADTVKGRIILGEDVYFANTANSFSFDENGLNITNGINTVTLDLNATNLLNIAKGNSQLLYLDDSGNLNLTGSITANTGYIGGENGWAITSGAIYNGTDSMSSTEAGTYIGVSGIRQYADDDAFINMQSGILTAKGVNLTGAITATSGSFTGTVTANDGYIGGTNGWKIETNKLYNGTLGAADSMYLGTINLGTATIAGDNLFNWRFTVGSNFGVTNTGALHCTLGKIGGWTITSNALYNGTDSMSSTTVGTYIGTGGFRQYASANTFINMQNGILTAKGVDISGSINMTSGKINIETSSDTEDRINFHSTNWSSIVTASGFNISANSQIQSGWGQISCGVDAGHVWAGVYDRMLFNAFVANAGQSSSGDSYSDTKPNTEMYLYQKNGSNLNYGVTAYANAYVGGVIFINPPNNSTSSILLYGDGGIVKCTTVQQTSDRNAKRNIVPLNKQESAKFIYSQEPVSYYYEDFNTGMHHGMVAQNVEQSIKSVYGDSNWSIVSNPPEALDEQTPRYKSLAYNEFIADIIATLQTQNERLIALESRV